MQLSFALHSQQLGTFRKHKVYKTDISLWGNQRTPATRSTSRAERISLAFKYARGAVFFCNDAN